VRERGRLVARHLNGAVFTPPLVSRSPPAASLLSLSAATLSLSLSLSLCLSLQPAGSWAGLWFSYRAHEFGAVGGLYLLWSSPLVISSSPLLFTSSPPLLFTSCSRPRLLLMPGHGKWGEWREAGGAGRNKRTPGTWDVACRVLFLCVWVLDDGAFVFDVFICFYVFFSYKTHARARGQHMDLRYWEEGRL